MDSDGFLAIGKHRGKDVNRVVESDPQYLKWVLQEVENISDEDRRVIEAALVYRR